MISRPSTLLRVFLMGGSRFPTKGETMGSSLVPKSLNLPLLLDVTPTKKLIPPHSFRSHPVPPLITDHIGQKGISISQTNFTKILPAVRIFCFTITTYFDKELELNSLIQNSVQQDYLPESYTSASSFLPKMPPPFNIQSITEHSHGANETSNKVTIYFRVPYYGDKGCSLIKSCICKIDLNCKKARSITFRVLYDVTKIDFFCSTIDKTPTLNQSFVVYEFVCLG